MKQTLYFLMALVVLSCSKDSDEPETLREYMESNSFFVQRNGIIEEGVNGILTTHLITFDFNLPEVFKVLKTYQYNTETYKLEDGCYFDGGSYGNGEWSDLDFGITSIQVTFNGDILQKFYIEKRENGSLILRSVYDYKTIIAFAALTNEKAWMDEYGLNYCLD